MKTLAEILSILKTSDYSQYYYNKPSFSRGKQSGNITYIPWFAFPEILDQATDGFWEWEIVPSFIGNMAVITGNLTIIGSDGRITRTAIGNESSDCDGYGDPTSNASAMAFRRAIALFGVGLQLWSKPAGNKPNNGNSHTPKPSTSTNTPGTISRDEWYRMQREKQEMAFRSSDAQANLDELREPHF